MLRIASDAALGATAGQLTFNGGTLQPMATMALAPARPVSLFAAGGSIDTAGFDLTLSGFLAGPGPLNKNSAGTLVLGNGASDTVPNAQTGTITVNGDPWCSTRRMGSWRFRETW